jgi:hypothetical protein
LPEIADINGTFLEILTERLKSDLNKEINPEIQQLINELTQLAQSKIN